uniref:Innexin n=1 Tax=Acrobeloides nanus TaxID=290746 RepID=A0A914E065_9BILA
MSSLINVLRTVPYSNKPAVIDVIAKIHSYFTCNLLIGLAILLSWKQFGGSPIECMLPLGFSGAWAQYAENYCWSEDTYYVSFGDIIENYTYQERREKRISYYQWMPFFLIFQAACFKFPTLIWKYFASQSGIRIGEILRLSSNPNNSEPRNRIENVKALTTHLGSALRFHRRLKAKTLKPHKILRFLNMKYSSHYVTVIYFIAKSAFLINVLIQLELLKRYLVPQTERFGFDTWKNLIMGNETWQESGLFPRVTLCDFEVREMGQVVNHTVQCVLLLNLFTEKVFILLYAWFVVLVTFTILNLTSWITAIFSSASREHFIFIHLEMSQDEDFDTDAGNLKKDARKHVTRFIAKYLRTDGIFLLRLIAQHADVLFTTDLVNALWKAHHDIEKQILATKATDQKWQDYLHRVESRRGSRLGSRIGSVTSLPTKKVDY